MIFKDDSKQPIISLRPNAAPFELFIQYEYIKSRSEGAFVAPISSWRPFWPARLFYRSHESGIIPTSISKVKKNHVKAFTVDEQADNRSWIGKTLQRMYVTVYRYLQRTDPPLQRFSIANV